MSSESSNCPIEWTPSQLLCAALRSLGVLAAASLWMSALPLWARLPLALAALARGFHLAWRESRRAAFTLHWATDGDTVSLGFSRHGVILTEPRLLSRGPLVQVSGRDAQGCMQRLLWWPDTLPRAARRRLRLASKHRKVDSGAAPETMPG